LFQSSKFLIVFSKKKWNARKNKIISGWKSKEDESETMNTFTY